MSLFSGLSRPLKAAGLALIGVAVIAAVIGGVSALTGGESNNTAASSPAPPPSTPSDAVPPTSGPASPPSSSGPPSSPTPPSSASPSSGAPTSGQPGQPGQGQPQPGQPGGDQQASNKWVTLRVYNNSLIKGLAERAAEDFRKAGWTVSDVSNYPDGVIPETTAYFRPGTDEEAAARQLAREFGMRAEPRFPGIERSAAGVIVIVTNNYHSPGKS
ncbi:LytR C-terminal domain-containing protein [Amycolatopsis sp. NPDC059021]|uniref:LytR C-terminal domain-containing protein n=1 Tax=Amycolatopsis sp. NPDC059021 TaxID=3346704 RepID=UPI00366CDF06